MRGVLITVLLENGTPGDIKELFTGTGGQHEMGRASTGVFRSH